MPELLIPRHVWETVVKAAREAKERGIPVRAFFLFCRRGKPFHVMSCKEVPVRVHKLNPLIFTWDLSRANKREYYPSRDTPYSYRGVIVIRKDLQLTLHDAYWAAIDAPGSIYIHVRLWIDENGNPCYEAHWIDRVKTHGEFTPIKIRII